MVEVVSNPCQNTFINCISNSKKSIMLCAPFISKSIIKKVLGEVKDSNVKMTVITRSHTPSFINGSSDIEAIEYLIDKGIKVYNYQNLHAKVYVFDKKQALVTSSNLTYNGLNRNFEYGLMVDDKDVLVKINDDYEALKHSELCGKFNKQIIKDIKKIIEQNKTSRVVMDEYGEEVIDLTGESTKLKGIKSGWVNDVFKIVESIPTNEFVLSDVYSYRSILQEKHPNNMHIDDKIRQMLQVLRDLGLIRFVERGKYKKLFIK